MNDRERQKLNLEMGLPLNFSQDEDGPLVTEEGSCLTFNGFATKATVEAHQAAIRAARSKGTRPEERTEQAALRRVLSSTRRGGQ